MDAADADRPTADDATTDGERAAPPHSHDHLELHVSRSRAFDAYLRDLGSWWLHGRAPRSDLHVEQHAGGSIVEHASGVDERPWGEVHEIEPGRRVRHSYRYAGERSAVVTAEFHDGDHGGATIDLHHEPWEGSDEDRAALQGAWTDALRRLEAIASAV
ncbi:SRPBCC domain-containing protein [Agrococcus jejuensis]|uniref:SRPBCC domain-containing protein n=1 Tax=Agrococcus jejuensis TaxID=399736 RepID=UPI0011A212C9|nr:SRPBCC domain-containing protein [Agrococcus jejuensis]